MKADVVLSRSTPAVKKLLAATFPDWRGRKVRLARTTTIHGLENFWDGGTRSFWKAVDLVTGRVSEPSRASANPFGALAHATVELPAGVVLVEHTIFCGKDAGITIHVRPETDATALGAAPAVLALPAGERS